MSYEGQEKESAEAFKERNRLEFLERKALARLTAATRTCETLDTEKGGITVLYFATLSRS